MPSKFLEKFNINATDQCILAAFNWKISGVATYEDIQICLRLPSGEVQTGQHLQDIVRELKNGKKELSNQIALEKFFKNFYEQAEERLEEDRDQKSNKIFTDKLLVKQRAKYDQEEAERRLTEERRELSAEFDMQILKASMKQKSNLLKKKEAALRELDKEVQIYRDTIKLIEKQESELNRELIGIHDNGFVQRQCIFACQVFFS
jgi:chromosome segregation ATPase